MAHRFVARGEHRRGRLSHRGKGGAIVKGKNLGLWTFGKDSFCTRPSKSGWIPSGTLTPAGFLATCSFGKRRSLRRPPPRRPILSSVEGRMGKCMTPIGRRAHLEHAAHLQATATQSSIPLDDLRTCIHCGLCTSACPTYLKLGSELDSPRGRIYLMSAVQQGRIGWTGEVVKHLDLCLECRACETACPSGVPYGRLLEAARDEIAKAYPRPWRERLLLKVFRDTLFPYPACRGSRSGRCGSWAGRSASSAGSSRRARADARALPPKISQTSAGYRLPPVVPAAGERRYRVALLTGCVASVLFARTNWATAAVLAHNGCEVVIPAGSRVLRRLAPAHCGL